MEQKTQQILYRSLDDASTSFSVPTCIDGLLDSGTYLIKPYNEKVIIRDIVLTMNDSAKLIVYDNSIDDKIQEFRVVVQTLNYAVRATGEVLVYTRIRRCIDGAHVWSSWVEPWAATTFDLQDHSVTREKLSEELIEQLKIFESEQEQLCNDISSKMSFSNIFADYDAETQSTLYKVTEGREIMTGSNVGISASNWYIADKPILNNGVRLKSIQFKHTSSSAKTYRIGVFCKEVQSNGTVKFKMKYVASLNSVGDGINGWHSESVDLYDSFPITLQKGDYIGVSSPQYFMGGYKDENPVGWIFQVSPTHDKNNIIKEYDATETNIGVWMDFATTGVKGVENALILPYEKLKEQFYKQPVVVKRNRYTYCNENTRIFLLGDSIASDTAVGGNTTDHNYNGWQKSLSKILNIPESNIIRGGMPGLGAGWFSGDATWETNGVKSVKGSNPDIIISIVGANDSGEPWTVGTFSGVIDGEPICRDIPFAEATQGQYGSGGAEYFIQNVSWIVQRYLHTYYDLRSLAGVSDNDSYEAVDEKMAKVKQPRLIICTTLPQNRGGDNACFSKPENWKRKRDAIVEVCNKYNIECVDLLEAMPWNPEKEPIFTSAVWENKGIYTMDGLHPNRAGFWVISEIICNQAGLVGCRMAE